LNTNFVYVKGKTLFPMLLIAFLLVSTNKVDVAAASPEATYFYVDPPEVNGTGQPIGYQFPIDIYVNDAPDTYAWEVHVSWDPTVVEVFFKQEGDFLKRGGAYPTTFVSFPSFAEANLAGEITVAASLIGDVLWASGTEKLFRLGFNVTVEGSSVLNLFDTFLVDHLMAGAAQGKTYYPNNDGFFYNEPFHDIAITSVTASLTEATELVAINVTVTNEGNYTETSGTFNVTVYADTTVYEYTYDAADQRIKNTTVVGDEIIVGTTALIEPLAPDSTTTLTFTWDTADVAGGIYTISAEVKGDDDTRNNFFIDGTVAVLVHDIAVTNVVPSPTEVTIGENVIINVSVENEGHFNETFDVTVYYDGTAIDTETGISLENGTSTTLTFTWDTTDVAKDTYTIKAVASAVPDEIDTEDNTSTFDGTVTVRGAAAPDILPYVAVVIVIIIGAAIAVYFLWFRKPT